MPGPGRPRLAERYGGHIRRCEDLIADRLPKVLDSLFALADGVTVAEATEQGERIYRKPPDRRACEYLVNRILGRPVEQVEHSGVGEPAPWEMSTDQLLDRAKQLLEMHGCQVIPQGNGRGVECVPADGDARANGQCVE
jgi:hypothetical protein